MMWRAFVGVFLVGSGVAVGATTQVVRAPFTVDARVQYPSGHRRSVEAVAPRSVPAAIYTDPPSDPRHPARSTALRIPDHGVSINGLIYEASGAGLHPTLVICHGLGRMVPGAASRIDDRQRGTAGGRHP